MQTVNIEREIERETTTNEEQHKGWRKVLERLGSWLSYNGKDKWLDQMRGNLGLMATVIATMTFQMALNPPGGVRSIKDEANPPTSAYAYPPDAYAYPPDANNGNPNDALSCTLDGYLYLKVCPGESVLAVVYEDLYFRFLVSNTICFIASLSILLLLVSGIPLDHRLPMWMLSIGMWVTLTSLAISYLTAVGMTTPDPLYAKASKFIEMLIRVWMILLAIITLCHTLRLIIWIVKLIYKKIKSKSIRSYSSIARQRVN
ncbi:hypothetical protein L195_g033137 [Trifolium pratense]|uniref:PGG domain-containing protein n=1 Tax=Trifolium pratense TaxID=57577 RepID=A0A2K3LF81_TRIPR|nr:hypothetical protein L195_g033137 [Trifolium pratense]